jgi:hypothetical protein
MSEESGDPKKSRLESVIPGLLKRGVEKAVERTLEAPADLKSFVTDMKLPKEIVHYIFSQVDETKNGLFRVVGHEVRDFLEHTNFAGEMQKILTTVQFEINTTIRFRPNKDDDKGERADEKSEAASGDAKGEGEGKDEERSRSGRPEVTTNVAVRRERDERRRRRGDKSDKSE